MNAQNKAVYVAPLCEVDLIASKDILTLSAGFDGEDHEFLLP